MLVADSVLEKHAEEVGVRQLVLWIAEAVNKKSMWALVAGQVKASIRFRESRDLIKRSAAGNDQNKTWRDYLDSSYHSPQ